MHFIVHKILGLVRRNVAELRWEGLALVALVHVLTTWALLLWVGETGLIEPVTFLYFYATTATTVGYGDLSPASEPGRIVAMLWVFPGAIAIFTAYITKAINSLSGIWRAKMIGNGDYSNRPGATILVGYSPVRTRRMIEELRRGARGARDDDIVLVTKESHPRISAEIPFVRTDALSDEDGLRRAGVALCSEVVLYADNDDETLAAAIAVAALAPPTAHIVAYFQEEKTAKLLNLTCPRIETVVSTAAELVVRAAQDPGAGRLIADLVSTTQTDAAIFSACAIMDLPVAKINDALDGIGTIIALQRADATEHNFAVRADDHLGAGDRVFYIADHRISLTELEAF